MKILLKFKSGYCYVGDNSAMVLNEPYVNAEEQIDLSKATDEEFEELKANPNNNELLNIILKRSIMNPTS